MNKEREEKVERDNPQNSQEKQQEEKDSAVQVEEESTDRNQDQSQNSSETAAEAQTEAEGQQDREGTEIEEEDPEKLQQRIAELESEIEVLKQENEQFLNKLQRSKADFANYRQRVNKEKFGLCRKYKKEVIQEILPVLDNLERALESCDREDDFFQGVKMIHKQICSVLQQEGVEVIRTEDQEFDPEFHEAVEQLDTDEHESGKIIEEMQKGYLYQDEVLRPALVGVAR